MQRKTNANSTVLWIIFLLVIFSSSSLYLGQFGEETHFTDQNEDIYLFSPPKDAAPNTPLNFFPINESIDVSPNIELGLDVSSSKSASLNVSFYNDSDGTLFGVHEGIPSGQRARLQLENLEEGKDYFWSAVINDGDGTIETGNYTFTTISDVPIWIKEPSDISIEYGAEQLNKQYEASDASGVSYSVNNTENFNIDKYGVLTQVGIPEIEKYTLNITASDPFGNQISSIITITIEDTTPPIWDPTPPDSIRVEYLENLIYTFNAEDIGGIMEYQVDEKKFQINNEGILTNATILPVGTYKISVSVLDFSYNTLSKEVIIIVEDTNSPFFEKNQNPIVELGETLIYQINATDASVIIYSINDTTRFAISPVGVIHSQILHVGEYNLEVMIKDPYNNQNLTVINVKVEDTTPPNPIDELVDLTIGRYDTFFYQVNATDLSEIIDYRINVISAELIQSKKVELQLSNLFSIDMDGNIILLNEDLPFGIYTMQIEIEDEYGNIFSDIIVFNFSNEDLSTNWEKADNQTIMNSAISLLATAALISIIAKKKGMKLVD